MISRRKALMTATAVAWSPRALAETGAGAERQRVPVRREPWPPLLTELNRWRASRRKATLWWRNDDVGDATPPLMRLFELVKRWRLPVTLSATPFYATKALAQAVERVEGASVIQHGYAHVNHAPKGQLECELDEVRPHAVVAGEIAEGMKRLRELHGTRFVPALAPPWYCIAPRIKARLAEFGFTGLSQYGPRPRRFPVKGVIEVNGHVEVVNWKTSPPSCNDASLIVSFITRHLTYRRLRMVDPDEATGIVTHHHAHDAACWSFLEGIFERLAAHPAVVWQNARNLFAAEATR